MRASCLLSHSRRIHHVSRWATSKLSDCSSGNPRVFASRGRDHKLPIYASPFTQEIGRISMHENNSVGPRMLIQQTCANNHASMSRDRAPHTVHGLRKTFSCLPTSQKRGYSSNSEFPAHQEIGMPSLSPTMTEGNIARWLKKEGDKISPGEVLCEVETDKATVEMECMEEGYLAKIIHGDGAKDIKVGELIAVTVEDEADVEKFKNYMPSSAGVGSSVSRPDSEKSQDVPVSGSTEKKEVQQQKPEPSQAEDRTFISPAARKLAEEHGVQFSGIKGSGPDGRIVKADIEDYLGAAKDVSAPGAKVATAPQPLDVVDLPLSQIRKVTSSRLTLSKQSIPHYYLSVDTCVDDLLNLRKQLNSLQEASADVRISVNDFVIKAAALALRKVPQCNSSWLDTFIRQYSNVNVGLAVQTDHGLFVPVVRDADKKGLATLANEVKFLAQKARSNNLKPADYEGGTFTVSNLGGSFGIKQFCAVINPPQAAILAVGSAEKRAIPIDDSEQIGVGTYMSVTLSCDHRVVDGAIGAEYLKALKGYIENPQSMLL